MQKLSTYQTKIARAYGIAHAWKEKGYSPEAIKLAFVGQGIPSDIAESIIKESNWLTSGAKMLGKYITRGGKALSRTGLGQTTRGITRSATGSGRLGGMQQTIGNLGSKAGKGLEAAGAAFKKAPVKSLVGGAQNFGKGLLFGGGKGLGGVAGKSLFAASTLGSVGSMIGGSQTPQMPAGPYGGAFTRYTNG